MLNTFSKVNLLCLFCCYLFFLAVSPGICRAETVKIPVTNRDASEVLPMVRTMLSSKGEVVVDKVSNSLIITDNEEAIEKIRAFLPSVDLLGKQVRIMVKFQEVGSSQDRSLSAGGTISGKGWEVSTKRKRRSSGVSINLRDQSTQKQRSSESFISVTSGNSAYIVAGEDIPYRERWLSLSRRYAHLVDTVVFRRVETGFEVRPVVTGRIVHLDITPRISYETTEGKEGTIRFTAAQTSISVPLGQWVSIGGTTNKENEVLNALLESGRGERGSSLSILMKAEAQ